MATSGQELSFGDFADLSPEENARVRRILHGQKKCPSRVEFPWDGDLGDQAEDEGNKYFTDKTGFLTDPGSQGIDYPIFQEAEFSFGTVQVSELSYGSGSRHIISFDDSSDFQETEKQSENNEGLTQAEIADQNTQSKLQASLKPYERRNKKKRPPDYYKERSEDHSHHPMNSAGHYERSVQQELLAQQVNCHVYNTPSVHNHSMDCSDTGDGYNTNLPVHGDTRQYVPYTPGEFNTHNNQPLTFTATVPSAGGNHITNSLNNQQGELQEVIVDSNNTAYTMPARTETYQIQDHIRTSSTQNVQFGDHCYSSVGNIIPVTVQNEPSIVNQINSTVSGHTVNSSVRDGITDTSSHQHEGVLSERQFDTGVSVNQSIPDAYIPGKMSQIEPQTEVGEHTTVGEPGNVNVSDSVGSQDAPETMDTDSNSTKSSNISVQQDPKPKLTWAGLFKGSSTGTPMHQVISDKTDNSVNKTDNNEVTKKQEKEFSPVPVPAKDDSVAEELGELLSQMTITHASVALQPRGLVNRGNWCYINGTLQALVACPPFYNLLKKMPRYPALSRGPSSTPILDSLVEFVHEFHPMPRQIDRGPRTRGPREISPGPPFEPSYVYKMLQAIAVNPHFKLGKQEDAEEFLSCILDGTHEEMAAAVNLTNKQPVDTPPSDSTEEEGFTNGYYHADEEEEIPDEENWEQVGPKKKSVLTRRSSFAKTPIADIFAGMIRSGVYKASAKETATLEPFFTLQLDIQSEKMCSVRDALEGLVSKEVISGYTDSKTNAEVEVVKKLSLEELPPVLILHLKFFVYNKDGGSQKLMKKVDYPVELEITKDLLSPNARSKLNIHQRSYKLFAVVYHHGKSMTGGHYTTCVFHPGINGWVLSDDSTVRTVSVSFVLKFIPSRVPYLLYYRRLDSH